MVEPSEPNTYGSTSRPDDVTLTGLTIDASPGHDQSGVRGVIGTRSYIGGQDQ